MKRNRGLEDYVNNKYLFVAEYAGYNQKNNSRVVKKVHFEDEKGNVIYVDHFNIYSNQFKKDTIKFKKSEKKKLIMFYGTISTYDASGKENEIDYCIKEIIVIR